MDTPGDWADARDDPAFVAGWDRCLEQVLAVLDELRATNPALPLQMRLDWDGALDAVRAHLGRLQAAHDAEGAGPTEPDRG